MDLELRTIDDSIREAVEAPEKIIEYFRDHGADHILLSTKGTNTAALSLYHKYRFAETGEMNEDETILRLPVRDPDDRETQKNSLFGGRRYLWKTRRS